MPATDIIFNIGTVGAEATAGAIKGIITNFNSLRKVVMEAVDSAQTYQRVVNKLDVDMREFNSTTAGQIDTFESYVGANEFAQAGIKVTAKEMATLGKVAIDHNRAIGGKASGSTAQYKKLVKAIVKAREGGVLPMGITLSQTTDKAKAQREIIDKLVDKYGDLEIQMETTAERTFAFHNILGTIKDQLAVAAWDRFATGASDTGIAIWDLVGALDQFSTDMKDTEGRLASWIMTNDGLTHSFNVMINTIGATITPFEKFNKNLEVLDHNYGKIVTKMKIVNNMMGHLDFGKLAKGLGLDPKQAAAKAADDEDDPKTGPKREIPVDFEFSLEEMETGLDQQTLDLIAGHGKETRKDAEEAFLSGFGDTSGLDLDVGDVFDPAIQEQKAKMGMEIGMAQDRAQMLAQIEAQITDEQEKEAAIRKVNMLTSVASIQSTLGNLQKAMDTNSKKGFEAAKNLGMAQVAIDTPTAAMAAYKSVVGVPYVGPILAIAAAGAATAAGIAQMAKIKRQKYTGGGGSASVSSAGFSSTSISSTANNYGAGSTQGQGNNVTNNILVDGQLIHSSMISANNNAAMRNEEHFTTVE